MYHQSRSTLFSKERNIYTLIELYRTDLEAIRPYLKDEYISILEEAYNGEVLETLIAYGFMGTKPMKEVLKEMLDFELMGEVFDHEG